MAITKSQAITDQFSLVDNNNVEAAGDGLLDESAQPKCFRRAGQTKLDFFFF